MCITVFFNQSSKTITIKFERREKSIRIEFPYSFPFIIISLSQNRSIYNMNLIRFHLVGYMASLDQLGNYATIRFTLQKNIF